MWYQLQIDQCHRDQIEKVSELLEEQGALSVTLTDKFDDPILEPELGTMPLWPHVIVTALFTSEAEAKETKDYLLNHYPKLSFQLGSLADEDWERTCLIDFQPQRFGHRLWVCPSWLSVPDSQAVNLLLDPGLAFGTGSHATTSLCLNWLDGALLAGKTLIDYGCGSGILALAALKLGALHSYAVDIDPQALQATQNNATLNKIDKSQLTLGEPSILNTKVDIVIANILLPPLMALQSQFHHLLNHQGLLVISGILSEQAPDLIDAYAAHFLHQQTHHLDGWSLLVFSCR